MRAASLLGILVFIFIAWLLSENKKTVPWRVIVWGLGLQIVFALFILKTSVGFQLFKALQDSVLIVLNFSDEGAKFLFGENFADHFFAFKVLPTIIFTSCLSYLMFYLGILQKIVEALALVMRKTMGVSGSESLVTAANIFVGQTESPLFVKPYLKTMTRSEINAMMTSGMATVAGGVMAAYAQLGIDLGHLLAASVMSAPAALVVAKVMVPETEVSPTLGSIHVRVKAKDANIFEAAVNGATEGLKLALNVGAMLLVFVALLALVNHLCNSVFSFVGIDLTLENLLGYALSPLAFLMGVTWDECQLVGGLIGKKILLNEFVAYIDLTKLIDAGQLSQRTITISTYALCGFANFSSIAIQIGGIGNLEETRRSDFARLGLKSMVGGCLAAFMTAAISGIFI